MNETPLPELLENSDLIAQNDSAEGSNSPVEASQVMDEVKKNKLKKPLLIFIAILLLGIGVIFYFLSIDR